MVGRHEKLRCGTDGAGSRSTLLAGQHLNTQDSLSVGQDHAHGRFRTGVLCL
jgi:hypothetical protein